MGKHFVYNICLRCIFSLWSGRIHEQFKKICSFLGVSFMLNNFPTFSPISLKISSILVYVVLSKKSLGLDAIHFRIWLSLGYVFKRFWQIFFVWKLFHSSFFAAKTRAAVAFHSWQLRFRAGRMQKTGPLWKAPQPIRLLHSFIYNYIYPGYPHHCVFQWGPAWYNH
jgi:hypothetical protein